jgi:branched-chain amino acid transport system substrate-binding protein
MNAAGLIGPYNSSVAVINLPYYVKARLPMVQMASTDATNGMGANIQPKTAQIAPAEFRWINANWKPAHVAIIAGTSTFLAGEADSLQASFQAAGTAVTRISIERGLDAYDAEVAQAVASGADTLVLATRTGEAIKITQAFLATGSQMRCFQGFAVTDPIFVERVGIAASQRCIFSGVPGPTAMPTARSYVAAYRKAFDIEPGTWGTFTYDSARILFRAMERGGSTAWGSVMPVLLHTTGFKGATGTITINPGTGNRRQVAVKALQVNAAGRFVIAPG